MANPIPKNLVQTEEAADLLGVGRSALTNYKQQDLIESERIGRHEYYDLDDLEELIVYLKENRLGPYSNRGGAKAVDEPAPKKKKTGKAMKLISRKRAAKLVGYSSSTISKWRIEGLLKVRGRGRYDCEMYDEAEVLAVAEKIQDEPMRKPRKKHRKTSPQAVNPFPFGEVGKPTLTNGADHGVAFSLTQAAHFVASWRQKHNVDMEQDAEWDLIQIFFKVISGAE